MADKEERILITQWNINYDICPAPIEPQCGIAKSCDDCKVGMSRQEAIEKISHALCTQMHGPCESCEAGAGGNENHCNDYKTYAEAALNSLLEDK